MSFKTSVDPLESPTASRESYKLEELAKELDTSPEQVEVWIREGNIKPMSDEEHAKYHANTLEQLRGLQ